MILPHKEDEGEIYKECCDSTHLRGVWHSGPWQYMHIGFSLTLTGAPSQRQDILYSSSQKGNASLLSDLRHSGIMET